MKNYLLSFTWLGIIASLAACNKDNNNGVADTQYAITATANSANERPTPTTSAGTASVTGTYHQETKVLNYSVTWQNLTDSATGMHFHGPATIDSSAAVQIPITGFTPGASGTFTSSATLTDTQATQLISGLWYYNIHTAKYPGGEIRGQLVVTKQ